MFPAIDPQKMNAVQSVSKDISAKLTIDHAGNKMILEMSSDNPRAATMIIGLLTKLGEMLAMQLNTFFKIQGKIVDINKPKK